MSNWMWDNDPEERRAKRNSRILLLLIAYALIYLYLAGAKT